MDICLGMIVLYRGLKRIFAVMKRNETTAMVDSSFLCVLENQDYLFYMYAFTGPALAEETQACLHTQFPSFTLLTNLSPSESAPLS